MLDFCLESTALCLVFDSVIAFYINALPASDVPAPIILPSIGVL